MEEVHLLSNKKKKSKGVKNSRSPVKPVKDFEEDSLGSFNST